MNNFRYTLRRTAEWMGAPRIAPMPRIVNGNNAPSPDRYPYFVALVDDRERIVCGGSLIASNVVLSAAHCGLANLKFAIVGKYYGQVDDQNSDAERIPIANTYSNPRFTLRDRSHDQLLVLLESPANANRPVVRLNLVHGGGDASLPSDRVTVLGLGQTYSSTQPTADASDVLQQVTMGVVPNRQCQEMYDEYKFFLPSISDDMVCLSETGKGQCYGDSGGPYVVLGDKPEDDVQIGTVAWGIDCAKEEYPAVGIRTYSEDDSFLRDTTCSIAVNPPSYFRCSAFFVPPQPVTPSPTASPSTVPSGDPTVSTSKAPTIVPTVTASDMPTSTPTVKDSAIPTTSPSIPPTNQISSEEPNGPPSLSPTVKESDIPTPSPSVSPTALSSENPSGVPSRSESGSPTVTSSGTPTSVPSMAPSEIPSTPFPSSLPTTCIARANSCNSTGDICCGSDVCQGGFCRLIPETSKQSGYKDDLKLTRATNSGVRGASFQSIGILNAGGQGP